MAVISDELHQLVNSLNTREAGYFSTWIEQLKSPFTEQYKKMLEVLRKQKQYDEKGLLKELGKNGISNNFSYHRTLFSGYIIDSLVAFNAQASTEHRIYHLLESFQVLNQRNLFNQAFRTIEKAKKEAQHYQKFYLLLQALEHERKLLKHLMPDKLKAALQTNALEKENTLKKINTEEKYTLLNDTVFAIYKELNHIRESNIPPQVQEIMQDPLVKTETNANTFDSKLKYHHIHALYAQLLSDYSGAAHHRQCMVNLWADNPHMITEMPRRYRNDLSALLTTRHHNGQYNGFEELIDQIEKVKVATNPEEDAGVFCEVYYLRQLYLLNNNRWHEALELIPRIERFLEKHEKSLGTSRIYNFWYNIAATYFITAHYKACQPWIEKLSAINRNSTIRNDLRDFAGIMNVILNYETGKTELVEYQLRNTKDRLKKGNKLYEFEKIILAYIGKFIIVQQQKSKLNEYYLQLLHELEQLQRSQGKQFLLGMDEIIIWARQKIA
ncbi:MAG: hypothetical protein POELPBGB_00227 [Bacteroidia bacterium]|nr:hypothetical protein [Bacteroidia bacterium]